MKKEVTLTRANIQALMVHLQIKKGGYNKDEISRMFYVQGKLLHYAEEYEDKVDKLPKRVLIDEGALKKHFPVAYKACSVTSDEPNASKEFRAEYAQEKIQVRLQAFAYKFIAAALEAMENIDGNWRLIEQAVQLRAAFGIVEIDPCRDDDNDEEDKD